MALTLGTLIEETKDTYHFHLVAGRNGLYRTPLWLYFSESIENVDFLKGGELIIITGFSSTGPDWLYQYITSIIKENACGLIVNTGKYILEEEISDDVLELCNNAQFPLLTMPWKIHLADVTQDMCRRIFESSHQYDDISHILMALASGDKLRRRDAALLEASGFSLYGQYCIAVFTIKDTHYSDRFLSLTLDEYWIKNNQSGISFFFQGYHILLFQNQTPYELNQNMESILTEVSQTCNITKYICGIGCFVDRIEHISDSFQSALEAHRHALIKNRQYVSFDELGIDKLFFSLPDKSILKSYCKPLEPLIDYDEKHNGELLKTLYLYLNMNKSIKSVAEALFCHRNTINYRINLIKSLLTKNLENDQHIFELQLAYHAMEYLGDSMEIF